MQRNLSSILLLWCILPSFAVAELTSVTWDHTARAEVERSESPSHPSAFNGCFINPNDEYIPRNWDGEWSYPSDGLKCAVESQYAGALSVDELSDPFNFSTQTRAESQARLGTRGVRAEAVTRLEFSQGRPSVYLDTDINVYQGASALAFYWLPSEEMAGAALASASNEIVLETDRTLEYVGPIYMDVRIEMSQDEKLTSGIAGSFEVFDLTSGQVVFSHLFENIETFDGFREPVTERIDFEELLGHEIRLRFSTVSSVFKEIDARGAGHGYSAHTKITGLRVVPEPSSASLLGLASVSALTFGRQIRNRTRLAS